MNHRNEQIYSLNGATLQQVWHNCNAIKRAKVKNEHHLVISRIETAE